MLQQNPQEMFTILYTNILSLALPWVGAKWFFPVPVKRVR